MTPQEMEATLKGHIKTSADWSPEHCSKCDQVWPCDAVVLLSALQESRHNLSVALADNAEVEKARQEATRELRESQERVRVLEGASFRQFSDILQVVKEVDGESDSDCPDGGSIACVVIETLRRLKERADSLVTQLSAMADDVKRAQAGWDKAEERAAKAEAEVAACDGHGYLRHRIGELVDALRDIAENFDCDTDAHRYNTGCRKCIAEAALATDDGTAREEGNRG